MTPLIDIINMPVEPHTKMGWIIAGAILSCFAFNILVSLYYLNRAKNRDRNLKRAYVLDDFMSTNKKGFSVTSSSSSGEGNELIVKDERRNLKMLVVYNDFYSTSLKTLSEISETETSNTW